MMYLLDPSKSPDKYIMLGLVAASIISLAIYKLRDYMKGKKNEIKKSD